MYLLPLNQETDHTEIHARDSTHTKVSSITALLNAITIQADKSVSPGGTALVLVSAHRAWGLFSNNEQAIMHGPSHQSNPQPATGSSDLVQIASPESSLDGETRTDPSLGCTSVCTVHPGHRCSIVPTHCRRFPGSHESSGSYSTCITDDLHRNVREKQRAQDVIVAPPCSSRCVATTFNQTRRRTAGHSRRPNKFCKNVLAREVLRK